MGITRGGNRTGAKWNKGGSMARKKGLNIDFSDFVELYDQLERFGGKIDDIVADAMEQTAQTVEEDTIEAMEVVNLPAGGKYSQGETKKSIVKDAKAIKLGSFVEIDMGFDKTKQGAGGFLITGTPKMRPNYALEKIYGTKKYESNLRRDVIQLLTDELEHLQGG